MPGLPEIPIPMRALLAGARRKEPALLDLIRKLVVVESPSDDKAAVDACIAVAASHAKDLSGRIQLHKQRAFGDVLEVRFGPKSKTRSPGRILLLGHLDTVWPLGTLKEMPCRTGAGRLWGPGTLDMKAGVAMALTAIDMLNETPIERFLEAMSAGLDGPAAEGKELKVNLVLTDIQESYVLWIENAVLHFRKAAPDTSANATLTLTKPIFIKMMAGTAGVKDTLLSDDLKVDGSRLDLVRFFTLIDKAPGTFQIVTK